MEFDLFEVALKTTLVAWAWAWRRRRHCSSVKFLVCKMPLPPALPAVQTPTGLGSSRNQSGTTMAIPWREARLLDTRRVMERTDMKTHKVRELARATVRVLRARDHEGPVPIRHPDGQGCVLTTTPPRRQRRQVPLPDFGKRMVANFGSRMFSEQFVGRILNPGDH